MSALVVKNHANTPWHHKKGKIKRNLSFITTGFNLTGLLQVSHGFMEIRTGRDLKNRLQLRSFFLMLIQNVSYCNFHKFLSWLSGSSVSGAALQRRMSQELGITATQAVPSPTRVQPCSMSAWSTESGTCSRVWTQARG